jgi:hypothetical protein
MSENRVKKPIEIPKLAEKKRKNPLALNMSKIPTTIFSEFLFNLVKFIF